MIYKSFPKREWVRGVDSKEIGVATKDTRHRYHGGATLGEVGT